MWTKEKIENFMFEFGFKPGLTKPEIKELPNILQPEETLHGLLEGYLKRVHNRDINGNGLVIVTNKRVIFFRKSMIGTVTKEEIPISKVSSSSFRKGLMSSSVAIITSNNEALVEHCDKTLGQRFSDVVVKLVSGLDNTDIKGTSQSVQTSTNNGIANLEQLEKLYELKQKGILTEEEYNAQKIKLLS